MPRGKLVGIINVPHRQPLTPTPRETQSISTAGFLAGSEIAMAEAIIIGEEVRLSRE